VVDVGLHRGCRDEELLGDLGVAEPGGDEADDVELAGSEPERLDRRNGPGGCGARPGRRYAGRRAGPQRLEQDPLDLGGERALPAGRREERLLDLRGAGVLGEEAARAGLESGEDALVVGVGGEDHDGEAGSGLGEAASGLDAVDPWHVEVHEDDVGPVRLHQVERLLAVGRGARNGDGVEQAQQHLEALADDPLVVDHEHADGYLAGRGVGGRVGHRLSHAGVLGVGRVSCSSKPSGLAAVRRLPPTSSARSRRPLSP